MTLKIDETTAPAPDAPASKGASVRPESAARESLSWIRALASQWEDDLSGSSPDSRGAPKPR